jgi:hypothetical protein
VGSSISIEPTGEDVMMTFKQVKEFLVSWGMHFDTPEKDSSTIPYPQVYGRMKDDATNDLYKAGRSVKDGERLAQFISRITDTTDGQTYLNLPNWTEVEKVWKAF